MSRTGTVPFFRFHIVLSRPAQLWTASIVFTLLGVLIACVAPAAIPGAAEDPVAGFALRALGWTLFGLGALVLAPMLATLWMRRRQPAREAVWQWWINFIGGLAGALAFAIPAALMFPVFLVAWWRRPNVLFPEGAPAANNLWLAALFSVLGLAVLAAVWFLARRKLREDRRQGP